MAITVRQEAPVALQGQAAMASGSAVGQAQGAAGDADITKFFLGLRQREREFDVNTALRAREQDIQQRQFNQSLAAQDARQQQLLYANEAQRQAQLAAAQMREEYDLVAQQQEQQFAYQAQAAKSLDEQVRDAIKASQQMKLNPEGQRILNELMGQHREVQQIAANARPAVGASLYGQWLDRLNQAGLDAYEVKEPTAAEKVYSGLVPLQGQQVVPGQALPPGKYRSLKGVRNGVESWETIDIPDPSTPTTVERFERDRVTLDDGGVLIWNSEKQDWKHIPPPKPEKPTATKPVDTSKYLREAVNQLRTEHQLSQTGDTPAPFKFDLDAAKARARELMMAEQELQAELGGTADEQQTGGGEPIPEARSFAMQDLPSIPDGTVLDGGDDFYIKSGPSSYEPVPAGYKFKAKGHTWEGTGSIFTAVRSDIGVAFDFQNKVWKPASQEQAAKLSPGDIFEFNGQRYRVTGPGEAEPI